MFSTLTTTAQTVCPAHLQQQHKLYVQHTYNNSTNCMSSTLTTTAQIVCPAHLTTTAQIVCRAHLTTRAFPAHFFPKFYGF